MNGRGYSSEVLSGRSGAGALRALAGTNPAGVLAARLPGRRQLLRPVAWSVGLFVLGAAFALGGVAALTVALAVLIALWALLEPCTALWMSTAFLVFAFVFVRWTPPHGEVVPEEFYFWGTGLLIITVGLMVALLVPGQVDAKALKARLRAQPSRAMALLLGVFLLASVYGAFAGNDPAVVARQLFGCLLLIAYYLFALAFLRTPEDVGEWLRYVGWTVVFGAAWYAQKLVFASLSAGSYYREASHLAGHAGAIAAVVWNEMLHARRPAAWLRAGAQLVCCVSVILFMGNRAAAGSFAVVAAFLLVLGTLKRGLWILVLGCCLLPPAVLFGPYLVERLAENPKLPGEIARRFVFPLQEDLSYQGRAEQWRAVLEKVKESPVLGAGMGSEFVFFAPGERHRWKVGYVDQGWGYLLLKTGLVGLAAFLLVIGVFLRYALKRLAAVGASRLAVNSLSLLALFLYGLVGFFGGPTFLHFSGASFFGVVLAGIVILAGARESSRATPASGFVVGEAAPRPRETGSVRGSD